MRTETAREENDRGRLLQEEKLSRKEVFKLDELGVAPNLLVRNILERQPDVYSEAIATARPLLAGVHDPRAGAGDDHEAGICDLPAKLPRDFVFWLAGGSSCRAEGGDFAVIRTIVNKVVYCRPPGYHKTLVYEL